MEIPCCSIELEPRTLNQGQLSHVREVAVDIVQKMEPIEASGAFMEGPKPVFAIKEVVKINVQKRDNSVRKLVEYPKEDTEITATSCQCQCTRETILESPEGPDI